MDISTVKLKLDTNKYQSVQKFFDDLKLITDNCYSYYPSTHHYVNMAKRFEDVIKEYYSQMPQMPQINQSVALPEILLKSSALEMISQVNKVKQNKNYINLDCLLK